MSDRGGMVQEQGQAEGRPPLKVGVLFKRSDYLKEYKPRYFAVEPPQLVYSLPESPTRVHKALDLTMCKISRGTASVTWGQHVLHILVVAKPGAGVSYTLGALTAEEADSWVDVLKKAAGDATRAFVKTLRKDSSPDLVASASNQALTAPTALTPQPSRPVVSSAERRRSPPAKLNKPASPKIPAPRAPLPQNQSPRPAVRQQRQTADETKQASLPPSRSTVKTTPSSTSNEFLPPRIFREPAPPNLARFLAPSIAYAILRIAPQSLAIYRGLVFVLVLLAIIVTTPALQRRRGALPPSHESSSSSSKKQL